MDMFQNTTSTSSLGTSVEKEQYRGVLVEKQKLCPTILNQDHTVLGSLQYSLPLQL